MNVYGCPAGGNWPLFRVARPSPEAQCSITLEVGDNSVITNDSSGHDAECFADTVEEFTTDCPSGWTTATHVRLLRSSCVTAEEAAVIVEADGAELHLSRGVRTLDVWERGDQIFATIGGDVRKVVVETVNRGDDYYPMWSIECSPLFELCESVRSALDARFWATFGDDLSDIEGALRECSLLGLGWDEFVGIVEASRGDHGICRRVVERLGAWAAADVDALD